MCGLVFFCVVIKVVIGGWERISVCGVEDGFIVLWLGKLRGCLCFFECVYYVFNDLIVDIFILLIN